MRGQTEHPVYYINRSDCMLGTLLGADGKRDRVVACAQLRV